MQRNYKEQQQTKKISKRILITALCTFPILCIVGILLGENFNRGLRIFIFVLILLAVVFLEEFLYSKKAKKQAKKPEREDVFK